MIHTLARLYSGLFNICLILLVAAAIRAGPHRVIFPEAYGLVEIAPRVWTDAPERSEELLSITNSARQTVATFFDDVPPRPTLILCATRRCAKDFGIKGNGLSVADMTVMVSPGGLTVGTLTHEMTHSRLHRSMGPRNLLRQPYPTWFDEGLATHVANHPRWSGTVTDAARSEVREVNHFWQWDDAYRKIGVGLAYRAAAAEVAAIENAIGRKNLLQLIDRAEAGEPFEQVLNNLISQFKN